MVLPSQVLLYSLGPFFSYPWKPIMNFFKGSPYFESYEHFWDQHKCPSNQAWHYVCLYFQIFSNFALLSVVDAALVSHFPAISVDRPLSTATGFMWLLPLLISSPECPYVVRFLSMCHMLLAYSFAPLIENSPIELWALGGFVVVTVIHLLLSRKKIIITSEIILYITVICLKIGGLNMLARTHYGILADKTFELPSGFAVIIAILCCLRDPVKGSVVFGSIGGSTLSVLIGQRWLMLLSYAYSASILQGLAHALSREQPTLLKLQDDSDREQKISHEWGHVVFFPNLLLHSIHKTLTGGAKIKLKKGN